MLTVLNTWKKMLNIKDKTVKYQIPKCVSSIVSNISLIEIVHKNFGISLKMRKIDQGL